MPRRGGGHQQYHKIRVYRESVVHYSLGMVASVAFDLGSFDEGVRSADRDDDLKMLFRIAMQCQIIDDVCDRANDCARGLPSFMTATSSLPLAYELTGRSVCDYRSADDLARSGESYPYRMVLIGVSAFAKLLIAIRSTKSCGEYGGFRKRCCIEIAPW